MEIKTVFAAYADVLFACLARLSHLRREPIEALQVQSVLRGFEVSESTAPKSVVQAIEELAGSQHWPAPQSGARPDASRLPCLWICEGQMPAIVVAQQGEHDWTVLRWDAATSQFAESSSTLKSGNSLFVRLRMTTRFSPTRSPSLRLVWHEIMGHPRTLLDIVAATVTITLLALTTSFYSMQVYDRVVPTQSSSTLLVLTLGVVASILLEVLG